MIKLGINWTTSIKVFCVLAGFDRILSFSMISTLETLTNQMTNPKTHLVRAVLHSCDVLVTDICFSVTSISYLVGWNRALLHFQSGLHCKVWTYFPTHRCQVLTISLAGVKSSNGCQVPQHPRWRNNPISISQNADTEITQNTNHQASASAKNILDMDLLCVLWNYQNHKIIIKMSDNIKCGYKIYHPLFSTGIFSVFRDEYQVKIKYPNHNLLFTWVSLPSSRLTWFLTELSPYIQNPHQVWR